MPETDTVRAFLSERHVQLAREAEAFASDTIAKLAPADEDSEARTQARGILEMLGEAGWCRYTVPSAYGGGTEAILAFLRAAWEEGQREWVSKLLLVGEGGVGKTSLLRRGVQRGGIHHTRHRDSAG